MPRSLVLNKKCPAASGSSIYVFDEKQNLIDWRAVTGEGESIKGLDGFEPSFEISLEQALNQSLN